MYKQPLTPRSWVFSSQGCKKCTVPHFNFTLLQVKVEDMCANAEISIPNYLFPLILTVNCKAHLENSVLELMSLQLFPWRYSSPAPFALCLYPVCKISVWARFGCPPPYPKTIRWRPCSYRPGGTCVLFLVLSQPTLPKKKKKSQIWFQREEVAPTFSINALLKKILDQNSVLILSGVINKQLNLRVLTDSILLREKKLKSFSTFQCRTSPSPLVSSLVSRRWHIIIQ